MTQTKSKNELLARRLAGILTKLNRGEKVEIAKLAKEFQVGSRTINRDLRDRLAFLEWDETGPKYYSLKKDGLGQLFEEDIERFAHFASIQHLFPKIDQTFFQKKLTDSLIIRGLNYEDISHKTHDFEQIKEAIESHKILIFTYRKNDRVTEKNYRVSPYLMINRNGIWYLIAEDNGQVKTFCFTQIEKIGILEHSFKPDQKLLDEIKNTESIYYGNQIEKVVLSVDESVAIYFERRDLLPNQSILSKHEDGHLEIVSENVSEQEIIALVRYWIPNLRITFPEGLQEKVEQSLRDYLA